MKDNLFDKDFTMLDAVKILLLIVTAFSTWNVVALMTPDTSFAFGTGLITYRGILRGATGLIDPNAVKTFKGANV